MRPQSIRPVSSMGGRSTVAPEDRGQWIVTGYLGQGERLPALRFFILHLSGGDKSLLVGLAAYDMESGKVRKPEDQWSCGAN